MSSVIAGGLVRSGERMVNHIPLHKMKKYPQYEHLPPVVLVECGSFSPMTTFHLQMMEMHRDFLMVKTNKYHVIGGLVSPVHDLYGKKSLIHQDHRIEMCRRACADVDWVAVTDFESRQAEWTRTRKVQDHIRETLLPLIPNVRVLLVMGADVLETFTTPNLWQEEDLERILQVHGVVVLERDGADSNQVIDNSHLLTQYKDHITLVPQTLKNNISSTLVRERLHAGMSVKWLIPDSCAEYIYQNGLYGAVRPMNSKPFFDLE